ncbi:SLD7 [[Candida] subhashii]|uniref:Mitochondrial morphogenesis protein SLD7 n=1 Tax=[Candida] subhashii TaxID=561895 RepID=A0A8J5R6S5_9ASCO|nr:SLD7 [[Candida] subhashii]KAG7665905.1 SLD7 [[Candida] subhashii]
MNLATTIQLYDSNIIDDVQLWSDTSNFTQELTQIFTSNLSVHKVGNYINYTRLPIFLFYGHHRLCIYSSNNSTNDYFKNHLVKVSLTNPDSHLGLLFKVTNDTYLVFYFDFESKTIRAMMLNFTCLNQLDDLDDLASSPVNSILSFSKEKTPSISATTEVSRQIFDKVLEKKKQRQNPFLVPTPPSQENNSSVLTTQDQINSAVNKVILSGLRIRGLSANLCATANEKLAIKEIHQMTYKATLFSLRKYNYSFHKKSANNKSIRLNDIQVIVEGLLQVFVDIDN